MKELKNLEAILFGVLQLIPEHQDYIITGLKKHLREFIQDDEQDEDMISQYTNIYNAIEKMGIRPQGNRNLPTTCSIRII